MSDDNLFVPYHVQGAVGDIRDSLRIIQERFENDGIHYTVRGKMEQIKKVKDKYGL